jgi:hypothetical protein
MFTDSQATMLHSIDPKKMPLNILINFKTQEMQVYNLIFIKE